MVADIVGLREQSLDDPLRDHQASLRRAPLVGSLSYKRPTAASFAFGRHGLERSCSTSSLEVVCPSWLSHRLGAGPSFEKPACFACLQGFELPKSSFCRRLL